MYKRITSKLFNTTTRTIKVEINAVKPRVQSKTKKKERKPKKEKKKPKKEEKKSLRTKCPYLRSDKTCTILITEGLDGGVSDVDIKHFCNGNPLLCYYFRLSSQKEK
ncbi:MAG: hypothetical protein JSV12_06610 [Candidatus Bathyarchaeota archaeon]|nr:MAG: hypothetical protein JSV12_06610 [Candidatus Bathyarchaeota archaeon]